MKTKLLLATIVFCLAAMPAHAKDVIAASCKLENGKNMTVAWSTNLKRWTYTVATQGKPPELKLVSDFPRRYGLGQQVSDNHYFFQNGSVMYVYGEEFLVSGDELRRDDGAVEIYRNGKRSSLIRCVRRKGPARIIPYQETIDWWSIADIQFDEDFPRLEPIIQQIYDY